jgi:protein-S-isoprenylcysteine O-methyltransferase Ste14
MTDEIITDGPYRKIRHPLYLSMIIALIGTSLMLRSFWGVLTIGMLFLPAVVYRARLEEKVLQAKFGRDWMNYQRRTSFLLPYLW